jgi:anti-anti-sigma regulatory factor
VLRITVEQNSDAMTFKLEGRVAGPWVAELNHLWEETAPHLDQRKLSIDLRATTYADAGGIRVLRAIYAQTGANVLAGTPWTQYLAEEITTDSRNLAEVEN